MDVKAKKLRREGFVTGNLFGREIEGSIPLKFTKKEIEVLLKNNNKGSQVMLELDGKTYDALIKEVDYNPLAHTVEEVDFQALVSNEMVHSTAEIILENEEKVMSGVLQDELKEGGHYERYSGYVRTIDDYDRILIMHGGKNIKIADIIDIIADIYSDVL